MPLFLDEECVTGLVTMDDALEALDELFREQGRGGVVNVPRVRAPVKGGILRITAGVLSYRGYYGIKISSNAVSSKHVGRLFCLYREDGADLCAIMQVYGMGALRTGAASGIATKVLSREDASTLGVIGAGPQARTQAQAICRVRPIREIRVYSPTRENRERFAREIAALTGVAAIAADSAEAAVRDRDVVVTATSSKTPVLLGKWLAPGTHVNAIGANYEHRRELDLDAVAAASCVAADDREQVQYEATDLVEAVKAGVLSWDRVHNLSDIVSGRVRGRSSPRDVTLFKSLGVAMEDVALAARAYERAVERKAGVALPDLDRMAAAADRKRKGES
jgi:ornithine cyclodeaminase/alanine dehydrogenase-like protein (mu-crystallin family)